MGLLFGGLFLALMAFCLVMNRWQAARRKRWRREGEQLADAIWIYTQTHGIRLVHRVWFDGDEADPQACAVGAYALMLGYSFPTGTSFYDPLRQYLQEHGVSEDLLWAVCDGYEGNEASSLRLLRQASPLRRRDAIIGVTAGTLLRERATKGHTPVHSQVE